MRECFIMHNLNVLFIIQRLLAEVLLCIHAIGMLDKFYWQIVLPT